MLIGDSITYYLDDDIPGWVNRGIGGDSIACVAQQVYWHILPEAPTDVIIAIGINDLFQGVDLETFILTYSNVITILQLKDIKISVRSILPIAKMDGWPSDDTIIEWNKRLKQMANDAGVIYLNTYPYFDDGTGHIIENYTIDGLHLSQAGIQVYVDNFFTENSI